MLIGRQIMWVLQTEHVSNEDDLRKCDGKDNYAYDQNPIFKIQDTSDKE